MSLILKEAYFFCIMNIKSDDGLVEGFETQNEKIFGFQFHIELDDNLSFVIGVYTAIN